MKDYKPTVVFDFDGVIHSYRSGWQGAGVISDPVVPEIAEAITALRVSGYMVVVVSTRCSTKEGMDAVKRYLEENAIIVDGVMAEKPPAVCYVDDRAICFRGNSWKLVQQVKSFKTWIEDPRLQQEDCSEICVKEISPEQLEQLRQALADQRVTVVERNPHPTEQLRPCRAIEYCGGGKNREITGRFHGWGSDFEEFCDYGPGNYSVAIVEKDDGSVAMCRADTIVFLDREAGK